MNTFLDFVNSYSKINIIDDKMLEIVNTGFKTYDNFSIEDTSLYIDEDKMENFCVDQVNNNIMIPITLNDPRLTEYIKIYKDMKSMYIDNCEYLLNLLEKNILEKLSNDESNETPHFTIKNISYNELVETETNVRNKLVSMYSGCHEQYQKGIVALYNALKKEPTVEE